MKKPEIVSGGRRVLLVTWALGSAFPACQATSNAQAQLGATADAPALVRVEPVREVEEALPIHAAGRLAPDLQAWLSSKPGGLISKVLVNEGDHVQRGQLLAAVDTRELDAQLSQLGARLSKSERDRQRASQLAQTGSVSQRDLDDAATARDVASDALAAARFNREHANIVAPFSGRVVRRAVQAGEVVAPGLPAFLVQSDDAGLCMKAGLVDHDALRIRAGDRAHVEIDATGASFDATVDEIAAQPSAATGSYEVRVCLPDAAGGSLRAGLSGKLTLTPSRSQRVSLLPLRAIVAADGERASVFVVEAGRARLVPVEIGAIRDDGVVLRASHDALHEVVTDGRAWIEPGMRVQVAPQLEARASRASAP